jgi:hypothetical protein
MTFVYVNLMLLLSFLNQAEITPLLRLYCHVFDTITVVKKS